MAETETKKKGLGKWDQKPVEEKPKISKVKVVVATKKKKVWNLEDDDDEQDDAVSFCEKKFVV